MYRRARNFAGRAAPGRDRAHSRGRACAIQSGELRIDVAFVGAPTLVVYGNINGADRESACGLRVSTLSRSNT
ncbi:MAG TPA: citrate lyase subunit alpha [Casimicrobiaceae bacterium]|nr:citrate lyase subunit alpha [Casimicrobiaceae bacterium]